LPAHAAALENALRQRGEPEGIEIRLAEFGGSLRQLIHCIEAVLPRIETAQV
jgi:hypothetical protein